MKEAVLTLMTCVFAASFCLAQDETQVAPAEESSEPAGIPKIACVEPVHDFGHADNNQDVLHTFVLKNEGDAPLKIANVRPSCGCTVAKISSKIVEPGGVSEVTAKLSLRGRKGPQRKSITVHSNDPKTPRLVLQLTGNATAQVEVTPRRLFLGQGGESSELTKTVEIKSNAQKPLMITGVHPGQEYFEAELETVTEGKHYKVHVKSKPPMPVGKLQSTVRLSTDDPKNPNIHVPVSINVVGELAIAPNEIVLREQGGGPVTRYVVVRPGKTTEFKIEEVIPPDESINVKIFAMGKNGYRIQLDNLVPSEALNGQNIRITTDVEAMKEILIPIKIIPGKIAPNA